MRDFTEGAVGRNIFLFGLPLILGNLFQQLYTFVNSAIVGRYIGDEALAAVGSVYPVVFFLVSLVIGIGSGGSVVVSHAFGAKRYEQIPIVISTFYIFFLLLGVAICTLSIAFAPQIFALHCIEAIVSQHAIAYQRVYMIGMFFSFCFNSAVSILRGLGDSKTQLYYLIGANVLNAVLSYIFVAKFHLSIVSTAWASVIAQSLACAFLFAHLFRFNQYIRPKRATKYFDFAIFREIVRIGLPTGVQQSVIALSQILILGLVAKFGTDALAAYSAASRIESIAMLFVLNFSSALMSFAGQNYGAGRIDRVKKGLGFSHRLMLCISVVVLVLFVFLPRNLMTMFSETEAVLAIGSEYLIVSGLFWFVFSAMNVYASFFRGIGYSLVPMITTIWALLLFRLPASYLLGVRFGTIGLWAGAPFSWILGVAIYLVYYKKSHWSVSSKRFAILLVALPLLLSPIKTSKAQTDDLGFLPPMNIPLNSSGHFAELRSNHFHSGIDLRTQGRENQYVICPFDGEVSRIKIQAFGGGKNLYIAHTNGYTTVYMHLNEYYGKIGKFVKDYQMRNRCYTFDYTVPKGRLRLKKGDTIALSGNTGSSGGPHLHYEIRNTATQHTINPILKGFPLQDDIAPSLYALRLIPCDIYSSIEGSCEPKFFDIRAGKDLRNGDTIMASGGFFLAMEGYDRSNGSTERNGVFDTRVYADSVLVFRYNNSSFSFSDSRYANAIVDYAYWRRTGRRMLWTKQQKGYNLDYVSYRNGGKIVVNGGGCKRIRVVLQDERGNKSEFSFVLDNRNSISSIQLAQRAKENSVSLYQTNDNKNITAVKTKTYPLSWNKAATLSLADGSTVGFKTASLYEDLILEYSEEEGKYSKVHSIHNNLTPLHRSMTLNLRYNASLKPYLDKALVVRVSDKGKRTSIGGKASGGFVTATTNEFGRYTVAIDTVAPKCNAKNFRSGSKLKASQTTIQVKVSDDLSGLSTYNAYVNGKWILAEYDGKSASLKMSVSDFPKGKSTLKIVLSDAKSNTSTHHFTIVR